MSHAKKKGKTIEPRKHACVVYKNFYKINIAHI